MSIRQTIRQTLRASTIRETLLGEGVDPLVFHALDDVSGSFVNDVIRGVGSLTETRSGTLYLPDDSSPPIWQSYGPNAQGKVYAVGEWWLYGAKTSKNSQIQSFDLTNAEWTATNMTVTKDQTGMRDDANGACKLVATAANATVMANAITATADDQLTRWFVKRVTGTGAIEITVDGGTTWQDVTTEADSTAGFNECLEDQAALANPQIGVRLVTSTDEVTVGNAGAYVGDLAAAVRRSTPIFNVATAETVSGTLCSLDDANHSDLSGLWTCKFMNAGLNGVNYGGLIGLGAAGRLLFTRAADYRADDGPNVATGPTIANEADDTTYHVALAYGDSKQRVSTDGLWGVEATYDGEYDNSNGEIRVLAEHTCAARPVATMLIRDIRRYDLSYDSAVTKGTTITTRGVTVGDSFATGPSEWPQLLDYGVQNYGVAGYGLVDDIEPVFAGHVSARSEGVTFAVIQGGVNDANDGKTLAQMQTALTSCVSTATSAGLDVAVIGMSPWAGFADWDASKQTVTDDYNTWLAAQATVQGFTYVDIYTPLEGGTADEIDVAYDNGDGLHPNAAGHTVISDLVNDVVAGFNRQ